MPTVVVMSWSKSEWSRTLSGLVIPALSALLMIVSLAEEERNQTATLDDLIAQLGAESFEVRQKAYDQVWAYGQDGVPALRKALKNRNPEVVLRASMILRNIEAGIVADLPPQITEAVARFNNGTLEDKREALRELKELGGYKQMVYLYSWVPEGENREALAKELEEVAIRAARNEIYSGDIEEAYKLLKISPQSESVSKARAWLAHRLEIGQQELDRVRADIDETDSYYELALLVGKGDRAEIQEFVEDEKLSWVSAMLELELGNSAPTIQQLQKHLETNGQAVFQQAGVIHSLRSQGDFDIADKLAEDLQKRAKNMRDHQQSDVIVALAINGYATQAVKLLEETQPLVAFDYYAGSEQPLEAMRVLQFPESEEEIIGWRDKLITLAVQGNGEERHYASGSLLRMTEMYYDRYGLEKAVKFIMPLAWTLQNEEEYESHDFIGEYFAAMPELGVTIALALFEEEKDFDYLVEECFSSRREIQFIRNMLKAEYPDLSPKEHFDMLAILVGARYTDPENMKEQQVFMLKKGEGKEDYVKLVNAFLHMALIRSDVDSILELTEILMRLDPNTSGYYRNIRLGVFELLAKHEQNDKNFQLFTQRAHASAESLTRWAAALYHLDRKEESKEKLDKALDLALDQYREISAMAKILNEAGMHREALNILHRQLRMSQPNNGLANSLIGQAMQAIEGEELKNKWTLKSAYYQCWTLGVLTYGSFNSENTRLCLQFAFENLFQQGMAYHENGNAASAVQMFDLAHDLAKSEGVLADHFFPEVKKAGYRKLHDQWFDESFELLSKVIDRFPNSHNSLNTAAWLGARSVREIDRSMQYIDRALQLRPHQGAYLDTKAELFFSKGQRDEAVLWSEKAVESTQNGAISPTLKSRRSRKGDESGYLSAIAEYTALKQQLWRFENEELPKE